MWLPWKSKWWSDKPETDEVSGTPEPEFVQISSTPDLSDAFLATLRKAESGSEAPEDEDQREDDPHAPDIFDPRDLLLYLDFGFDGQIPVGIDLSFSPGSAADPDEILSQSQALLDAGLTFAARQLLARLAEPASSSGRARWLTALLLWRRFRNAKERRRRGWGADLLTVHSSLWLGEAERLLQDAVEIAPTFGEAWLSLAQIHLEPGARTEPSHIVEEALRACELLGDAPAALLTLGRALRAAGRPGDAIATFERIPQTAEEQGAQERELELARLEARCLAEPIDVAAYLALGRWCLRHDQVHRARELLTRLAELSPERAEGLYGLGRLALIETEKSWDERQAGARRLALAALSRDPRLGLAHELLGIVYNNLRSSSGGPGLTHEDPLSYYRRAVEFDPTCDYALVALAQDHLEHGEIGPAITQLEEAIRVETQNAFAYRLLALLYECTRRYDQFDRALAFRRKADDLEPETELAPSFVEKVRRLCHYEF